MALYGREEKLGVAAQVKSEKARSLSVVEKQQPGKHPKKNK
jgi:hypothetical protein